MSKDRNKTSGLFLILLIWMMLSFHASLAQQTEDEDGRRHILILNSYHKEFQWTDDQVAGVSEILRESVKNLELYVEYMDTKRIYTAEYLEHLTEVYLLKYDKIRLDVIITTDDNALAFVIEHHKKVFQGAPVSFCGINDFPSLSSKINEQLTGLVEVLDIGATIDLALQLHAETRKVYVIVDSTPTGLGQFKDIASVAQQYRQLEFEYLKGEDYSTDEMLEHLPQLPQDSIVLLAVWLRDKNNDYAAPDTVGPLISKLSCVPVYGIIDMYLGSGIIGGKLLNSKTHGRLAAQKAVLILNGEEASNIPVLYESRNPYMFDDTQLRRWDIDPSRLPEGSVVINRSFSLYETYRTVIWIIAGSFVLLMVVITILAASIIRRKQAEEALRDSAHRLRFILDNLSQSVFLKDRSGVFVSGNKNFANQLGISPEDISGKTDYDIHPKQMADKYRRDDIRIMNSGQIESYEEKHVSDGKECIVQVTKTPVTDNEGNVTGILGIFWDITERKQAEEALKKSEEQFKALAENSPLAIYMSGSLDQVAEYINPTFHNLFGYTIEDVPDLSHWWPLAYPDANYRKKVADEWQEKVAYAVETQTEIEPMEVVVTCKDGVTKNVLWRYYALGDQSYACGLDLTARKQAEKALRESEERYRTLLQTIGDWVWSVNC